MNRILLRLAAVAVVLAVHFFGVRAAAPLPFENPYAFGLDLSFVLQAEQAGRQYYDVDGTPADPWSIFRGHGYNWGRLMICNEPSSLGQDLDYVLEGAAKLKEHGYHFALDFMMSDGWANPMTQPTPSSFTGMSHEERVKAFHDYVLEVITALKDAGTLPEIVQVAGRNSVNISTPGLRQ